jgi:hypothetical protein
VARVRNYGLGVHGKAGWLNDDIDTRLEWADQPDGSKWRAVVDHRTPDGWRIRTIWVGQDGVAVVKEIHVTPSRRTEVPRGGFTEARLRELRNAGKLSFLKEDARTVFVDDPQALKDFGDLLEGDRGRLGGRRAYDDVFYAQLAVEYQHAAEHSRTPIAVIADNRALSRDRVSELVRRCRSCGFLSPAKRGVAGGVATEKARALLERLTTTKSGESR